PLSLHDALPIFGIVRVVRAEQADRLARLNLGPDLGDDRLHAALVALVRTIDVEELQPGPLGRRLVAIGLTHGILVEQIFRIAIGVDRKSTRLNSSHVKISY